MASRVADVVVGGARPVTIHVPAGYDANRPAPLLIVLHGYSSSGKGHDAYFHLGEAAMQRGFLYAYPDGTVDSSGNHFWNATDACCDFDPTRVDDVAYLAGVIAETRASLAVDPKRIYLIGHSNGAFMSHAMACAHADQIGAIVSLAGATFVDPADCAPAVPVAVLQIHGTADDTIAFKGGQITGWAAAGRWRRTPAPRRRSPPGRRTTAARTRRSSTSTSTSTRTFPITVRRPRPR